MKIKQSLLAKLLLGMTAAAILPFAVSNVYAYRTTTQAVERQIIELNQKSMANELGNVKRYIHGLNQLSVSFYYDETLLQDLRSDVVEPTRVLYVTDQVSDLYNATPDLRAVRYFHATSGQSFTKSDVSPVGQPLLLPFPEYPEGESLGADSRFEVGRVGGERVLAVHTSLPDLPRRDVLGFISLYAGLDEIERFIRPLSDEAAGEAVFLYLHRDMQLLYGPEEGVVYDRPIPSEAGQGSMQGTWAGKAGIFVFVNDRYLDLPLTLVKFVPEAVINRSANQTLGGSLALQAVSLAFVIAFVSLLAVRTIVPIRRLAQRFAQVETGNFRMIDRPIRRVDEIGMLERRFQVMVRRLDDFINREYRHRLELSTARLKMLQAQINPHFLYNALQTINTMALRLQAYDISDKLAELGSILRYGMDFKKETVRLQKEIEHIEAYLSLQTGRFKHKLSYTLSCPEEALRILVPKMILQPLVENSIIHGIEKGRGTGTLHIGIDLGEALTIRVMDTGKGMDAGTIERIRQEYEGKNTYHGDQGGGIGLLNVLQRLRLHYGTEFTWEISSKPYEATVVAIRIPIDPGAGVDSE